jgi:MFS family permease
MIKVSKFCTNGEKMQLIVVIILGSVLGFVYGSFTDGFVFSTNICLFAGLTLIMPSLFKFELGDIRLVWEYRLVLMKGFLINYIVLPLFAVGIGLATQNFGIAAGLFLISVLSGGGMVMHWIKKTNADTSLGFLLLFINLLFISFSLLLLHLFATYSAGYFGTSYDEEISIERFAGAVIELLIVIPFLASRVLRYIKPLLVWIETYRNVISQASIFIILFYLFGLQNSQLLAEVYDFEPELFLIALVGVAFFYLLTWGISSLMYDLNSPQQRAAFWHSVTRYLTLALVISTFSMGTFGVSMLLPIMFGYMVQIPLSVYIDKKQLKLLPQNQ